MCSLYMLRGPDDPNPEPNRIREKLFDLWIDFMVVLFLIIRWTLRIVLIPAMIVTWPWWGYRYYKSVMQ